MIQKFIRNHHTIANSIMPDPGYEIEEFQYYTWQITSWTILEKRITGPEFEAGGWKCSSDNNSDVVSIYLDFADTKCVPDGWHCCVQFALMLWNPEDPSFYVSYSVHHRFTAEEPDWGFTRFYAQKKLFTRHKTNPRPLIENDTCNITAFVRIIKDPTGVLWHKFINYDSKKVTGYVNLKNQGTSSYLNVELQLLYSIKYFRKAIYQIPTEDDEPIKSIPLAIQRIFYNLQVSDTPVETTELTKKSFGMDPVDGYMQYDVQGFDRMLLDCLENKMKLVLFVGEIKNYVRCVNVDYESSFIEDYYGSSKYMCLYTYKLYSWVKVAFDFIAIDIQLEVKGCKTLNDSFLEYIREESCEGDNKYQTEIYGLQINDHYEYPMEIDLQGYLSSDSDMSKSYNYLLHGVIVHNDESHEGSYYILLKPEKNGKWFKFDDNRVTPVTEKDVFENNYGGEVPKIIGTNVNQFTSAYILVYIRESDIDFVLSPVLAKDIPKHIRKERCIDKEKALYEQIKKEAKEHHLYLTIKILTLATFEHHQGFDLANIDDRQYPLSEFTQFKILKSEIYGAFKAAIVHKFGIPAEQMRFWVLVTRQNKTVRPDIPIPDNFLGIAMEEVYTRTASRQNELKLFLEVADKQINDKAWFPTIGNDSHILIFINYFDTDKQSLKGVCSLYVRKFDKIGAIIPILCEKKNFPQNTPLNIYEEIKQIMIVEMKLELTFQQSETQNGDVICFQKALTEHEIQEHTAAGHICDIPTFYESLSMRFRAAKHVASFLKTDPLKLRFTVRQRSGQYKTIPHSTTKQTLSEILQDSMFQHVLYYEILDISIIELETKNFIKEIPQDEIELGTNDEIINVFHFTKKPLRAHGIPFKFVLKTTKLRLRLRLGMNEEDFLKVKVAIIRATLYAKPQYIENNDVILSDYGLSNELLGLDHVVKTGRAERIGGEKAMYIRG
ncbi:24166_t:CDS:10 [Cetraspora pellucida]|uniref:ubiquitinyl hydrolase 1 n=1 Tax=Cetraspora pellucida TaxID=1433469 RepID=A0A9N8W638_9GLOM|nr:24166_t:CDS:10 [Cetraspora pellucida]